jgi:hypothetical protein
MESNYGRRNLEYIKPPKFQDHLTITELSRHVGRDPSWLKRLERDGRIPTAARVEFGELNIRLWSPAQVSEIVEILSRMKVGRPPGS